jgi:hypothetical protein
VDLWDETMEPNGFAILTSSRTLGGFPAHELSRPPVERFRSHSRTRWLNFAQTSGFCNSAVLSIRCDALRTGLPPPPVIRCASNPRRVTSALITWPLYGYSFRIRCAITIAFASPSFLLARRPSRISRASELASSTRPLLRHQIFPWRS